MLFGTNPFFDYDDKKITQVKLFKRIVKGKFQTPVKEYAINAYSNTSKQAKDLIRRLLESNPDKRLGCLPGEDLDIRRHPWFAGFDWGKLYRKELKAPWVPQLSDPFDGKNFNEVKLRKNNGLRPLEETEQELFESFC
jgi:protein kinase A